MIIRCIFIGLAMIPSTLLANTKDIAAYVQDVKEPLAFFGDVLLMAAFVLGVCLFLGGMMLFRQHKINPKLVPLPTPIVMVILGIGGITLPYLSGQKPLPSMDFLEPSKALKSHLLKAEEKARQIEAAKIRSPEDSRYSDNPNEAIDPREDQSEREPAHRRIPTKKSRDSEYWPE